MRLPLGELPDDHYFVHFVHPLTDWAFKMLAWLLAVAAAWKVALYTGDGVFYGIAWVGMLLLVVYLCSCIDWLCRFERNEVPAEERIIIDIERAIWLWRRFGTWSSSRSWARQLHTFGTAAIEGIGFMLALSFMMGSLWAVYYIVSNVGHLKLG
jgi:hypothetical protein